MAFTLDSLHRVLQQAPSVQCYKVGLSGGMDSVVLLHALCALRNENRLSPHLHAIHINHGLSPDAEKWQQFCAELCESLAIGFKAERVQVNTSGSIETAARESRYNAFVATLAESDLLLLAHHLDDQLETALFRLMRGAGPRGLAGMPRSRTLGKAGLFRPLLEFSRQELKEYAQQNGLTWQEDASNAASIHDRNYLRHEILPLLEKRWPEFRSNWAKSLQLAGESKVLLEDLGAIDLQAASSKQGGLHLQALQSLSNARQRNLLRYWLQQLGLPEPGWHVLHQLVDEVIAADDFDKAFSIGDYEIYRFQEQLFVVKTLPDPVKEACDFSLDRDVAEITSLFNRIR